MESYSQAERHIPTGAGKCCSNGCQKNEEAKADAVHVMTSKAADNGEMSSSTVAKPLSAPHFWGAVCPPGLASLPAPSLVPGP